MISKKLQKKLKTIFPILITIIIFSFLMRNIDFMQLTYLFLELDIYYLIVSLIMLFLTLVILNYRWYIILRFTSGSKIDIKSVIYSFMAGLSLNSVLPSKLGDFYKIVYFKKQGLTKVAGMVIAERLIDIFVLSIMFLLSAIILNMDQFIYIGIFIVISFLSGSIIIPKIRFFKFKFIKKLSFAVMWLIRHPKELMILFIITSIGWLVSLSNALFLSYAIGINASVSFFFCVIIFSIFISMIPITISGMGTRDAIIIFFLGAIASKEMLIAYGLLFTFFRYWFVGLLGIPFLINKNINKIGNKQ